MPGSKPPRSAAWSRALDAVENMTDDAPDLADNCIVEAHTPAGYWWRYRQSEGEPDKTLRGAMILAAEIAAEQARRTGLPLIIASSAGPPAAIYVFDCNHPDAHNAALTPLYEFTPGGACWHLLTRH